MSGHRRGGWSGRAAVGTAILSVLYLLSSGPVFRGLFELWKHEVFDFSTWQRSVEVAQVVYAPLDWACQRSSRISELSTRYLEFWVPDEELVKQLDRESDRFP